MRARHRLLDTMVKPSSSGVERAVVKDDEAMHRDGAATGVATVLGGEAETDGGTKWL